MIKKIKNTPFFQDVILTFSVQLLLLLSNFLINKILSIRLGVSDFGLFNLGKRAGTLIGYILLAGQGIALPRYLAMEKSKDKNKITFISSLMIVVSLSFFIFIVFIIFPTQISNLFFGDKVYKNFLFPVFLFALFTCLSSLIYSFFRGVNQFRTFAFSQIIIQLSIFVVIYFYRNPTPKNTIFYWSISMIPSVLFLIIYLFKKTFSTAKKTQKLDLITEFKEMIIYGIPRIVGEIVQFSYYLVPLVIVNKNFGGYNSGIFSASTGILQMMLPFFSYLGLILLPRTSKKIAEGNFIDEKKNLNKMIGVYVIISTVLVVIGEFGAELIIRILYSKDYLSGISVARILLLSLIPRSLFLLLRNPIDAISSKPYNTYNLLISFFVMLLLMINSKCINMVAWSFVIADCVLIVGTLIIWKKSERIVGLENEEKI